jgi:uncharacterized lipoprotein YehR (DUF1307 family)
MKEGRRVNMKIKKKVLIFLMLCIFMLTACLKKEEIKFSDILNGVIINKIEFRNGGNGFLD